MKEGDVVLVPLPQANGQFKIRPALLLRRMPAFGDWLVTGISTQLHQFVKDFDERISTTDADFKTSGLKSESIIRLGFLAVVPNKNIPGTIGFISAARHKRLLKNLSDYLVK